ncbi:MAG: winged helix-turn-helix domain-containing protein [Anaerolineae bacterium]
MKPSEASIGLGAQVFDSLRAEYEASWLDRVFVAPTEWNAMTGMRSILVFGESGSGKTALNLALTAYAEQTANVIPVIWKPLLPTLDLIGSALVQDCAYQILNACARALLQYFGQRPDHFALAPAWVQDALHWFLDHCLHEDRQFLLSRLEDELPPEGFSLIHHLMTTPPMRLVLSSDAPPMRVVAQLMSTLRRLGLQGVWVLVDGLESWLEIERPRMIGLLQAWLAALSFFEDPSFAIKLVVPAALRSALMTTGGVSRRRLDVHHLVWTQADLIHLVERRLMIASGQDGFCLNDLCPAPDLTGWLTQFGGSSPRGWLELIRPVADFYLARSPRIPLAETDWASIRRRYVPPLHLDLASGRVFIGYGEVTDLGPMVYRVLRYLYEQRPRLCSREELWYRAYLGHPYQPRGANDRDWQSQPEWAGTLDTILWRLRRAIEPELKSPVYIITERNMGVRLDHTL